MMKRFGLYISGSLLRIVVFFGLSLVCFSLIVTNPQHLKNIIADTGVYSNLTPAVIQDTLNQNNPATLPINDKNIQSILTESFSGQELQSNTENVIDASYSWLQGNTEVPNISFDLTKQRQLAADSIAAYAFTRLEKQPTCFAIPESFDPFTAGCKPPFTDLNAQKEELSQQIAGDEGILPKATYSTADLPKDTNNQYIYERYSYAPRVFNWLKYSSVIVSVMFLLASIGIVSLSKTKREGFQRLGVAILSSAVALILTPLLFSFIIPNITKSVQFTTSNGSQAQQLVDGVIDAIVSDFYALLINVSIQLILLGTVILLIEKLTRPNSKYANLSRRSGVVTSHTKKPSTKSKHMYGAQNVPVQSSEESKRHRRKRTKDKKYRRIPKKEI